MVDGALSEIVRTAHDGGMSFDRLAERGGVDPEGKRYISRPWVSKLARGKVNRAPELGVVKALAQALGKPPGVLQAAAAEQFLDVKLPMLADLSEEARTVVTFVVTSPETEVRWLCKVVEAWAADRASGSSTP